MDVITLLDNLEDLIETGPKVPMIGKVMISKKEALDIIEEIVNELPDEFKKAQWVIGEKEKILKDAKEDAEAIRKEINDKLARSIENHDITKEAKIRSEEIIAAAQRDAKEMRLGARDYAGIILSELEDQINTQGKDMVSKLKIDVEEFISTMSNDVEISTSTIRNNIKELKGQK